MDGQKEEEQDYSDHHHGIYLYEAGRVVVVTHCTSQAPLYRPFFSKRNFTHGRGRLFILDCQEEKCLP